MSTYASDLALKTKSTITNSELETASKEGKIEVSTTKPSSTTSGRLQRSFGFRDGCGNILLVYVSGGSEVAAWHVACAYAENAMDSNGCY